MARSTALKATTSPICTSRFDTHQIVMAEGIPSESFFPDAEALNALDQATRDEILTLFPEWRCPHLRPQAARHVMTAREARALI